MTAELYPVERTAADYYRAGKKVPSEVHEQAMKNGKALVKPQRQEEDEQHARPLFPGVEVKRNPW